MQVSKLFAVKPDCLNNNKFVFAQFRFSSFSHVIESWADLITQADA